VSERLQLGDAGDGVPIKSSSSSTIHSVRIARFSTEV